MKLEDLMKKYGDYEVTGIFDNDGDKPYGYVTVGLKRAKPKSVWDLKKGVDTYYYVDETGDVGISTWYDWECDRGRFNIGSAFLTEEEAEKDVERKKVEALLLKYGGRRWLSHTIPNYYLAVNGFNELYFTNILSSQYPQGIIYFDSGDDVQNAINKIGKDRIVKALFEVR
jgi:hypothetical protein